MRTIVAKLTGADFDTMADRGAFDCLEGKKTELIRGELRFLIREEPIHDAEAGVQEYWVVDVPSSRIHVLSKSDGKSYRRIEIAVAPQFLSPSCLPSAKLDLTDLFSVT